MHTRKKVPKNVWSLTIPFSEDEQNQFVAMTESQQEKMIIEKYCSTRGKPQIKVYDMLNREFIRMSNATFGLTVKTFKPLFKEMRKLFPHLKRYTHLVHRSIFMIQYFLEDQEEALMVFLSKYELKNGKWKPRDGYDGQCDNTGQNHETSPICQESQGDENIDPSLGSQNDSLVQESYDNQEFFQNLEFLQEWDSECEREDFESTLMLYPGL
ncbi:hypothetical protein TRFO_39011 [Tritrichomonas foetus]|uniref:Uncharacterized protein n=1 Tax=Tritrichomonas foetus TaxID=1144522 RepID=A0A1J4JBI4_9EUKA|nr:hypothetical protein TRFO_39011 [Tritrichomonas foetus]|eukprot:OHS94797.1 hypothetical protein TRFO_39011 [Tritrichomonas foetus]